MRPIHILLVLAICAIWGGNFVVTKLGLVHFPPIFFSFLRFAVLILVLFPFLKIIPGRMRRLLLFAFTLGVLHYSTILLAISWTGNTASLAIINQIHVPFSVILAVVILREQVGWKRWFGIGLAFSGVMVMGFDPEVLKYPDALIMMIVTSFILSCANVMARGLADISPMTINAWVSLVALGPLLGLSAILETGQVAALTGSGPWQWAAIAYTALLVTLVGHGSFYYLLRHYGVAQVTPWFLLLPFFAVALGVAILGDVLTLRILAGGGILLAGVAVITFRSAKKGAVHALPKAQ